MSPLAISAIVFVFVFGGAMIGMILRSVLPPHHLSDESKYVVKLGMGLVATIAALVLGLLVASAQASYDSQNNELTRICAKMVFLDRVLSHFGPEAGYARGAVRDGAIRIRDRLWPRGPDRPTGLKPIADTESIFVTIQMLSPKNEEQRVVRKQALRVAAQLGEARWLMYEESSNSVPAPMLVVMVLWLSIIFVSFGLFSPGNATVVVNLLLCALAVACAVFLILEMYRPFEGVIRISSAPLTAAIASLGQ